MTPKQYMIFGALYGSFMVILSVTSTLDSSLFSVPIFAFGAIFGKGYGIWEERNK